MVFSSLTNCEVDGSAYFVKKRFGCGIEVFLHCVTHQKVLRVFLKLGTKPAHMKIINC